MLIKELVGSVSTIRTDRRKLRQFSGYVESDPIYCVYCIVLYPMGKVRIVLYPMGKVRAELVTPQPDRFVADHHATLEEQLFDIPHNYSKWLVHNPYNIDLIKGAVACAALPIWFAASRKYGLSTTVSAAITWFRH
jgi:hypothetical protein